MKDKDLKKLNRYQLLELLIVQTERADKLEASLKVAEKYMVDQMLQVTPLGSIAEASIQIEGVFQAAQKAADMYIDAAKKKAEEIEQAARKNAEAIIAQAEETARRNTEVIIAEAEEIEPAEQAETDAVITDADIDTNQTNDG